MHADASPDAKTTAASVSRVMATSTHAKCIRDATSAHVVLRTFAGSSHAATATHASTMDGNCRIRVDLRSGLRDSRPVSADGPATTDATGGPFDPCTPCTESGGGRSDRGQRRPDGDRRPADLSL